MLKMQHYFWSFFYSPPDPPKCAGVPWNSRAESESHWPCQLSVGHWLVIISCPLLTSSGHLCVSYWKGRFTAKTDASKNNIQQHGCVIILKRVGFSTQYVKKNPKEHVYASGYIDTVHRLHVLSPGGGLVFMKKLYTLYMVAYKALIYKL